MLSGFVQFYSPERKEPGKPLQIILKKVAEEGSILNKEIASKQTGKQTDKLISSANVAEVELKKDDSKFNKILLFP